MSHNPGYIPPVVEVERQLDYHIKRRFEILETLALALVALELSHKKLMLGTLSYRFTAMYELNIKAIAELKSQIGC